MKKRLQAQDNLLRWNNENNFFRPHLRHHPAIIQRKWEDIPSVPKVIDDNCWQVSEAIDWRKLLYKFYREDPGSKKWTEQAWLTYLEKGSNNEKISIAWTSTETFCACAPSKAILEETKLINHCRTMWKSRSIGLNIY